MRELFMSLGLQVVFRLILRPTQLGSIRTSAKCSSLDRRIGTARHRLRGAWIWAACGIEDPDGDRLAGVGANQAGLVVSRLHAGGRQEVDGRGTHSTEWGVIGRLEPRTI